MTPPAGTAARAATTEAIEPPAPAGHSKRTAVASFVSSVLTLCGLGSVVGVTLGVHALLLSTFGIVTWLDTP